MHNIYAIYAQYISHTERYKMKHFLNKALRITQSYADHFFSSVSKGFVHKREQSHVIRFFFTIKELSFLFSLS